MFLRRAPGPTPHYVRDLAFDDTELAAARDQALAGGDHTAAADLLASTWAHWDRRGHVVNVLGEAASGGEAQWLGRWLAERPDDPGALLVRGAADMARTGEARGSAWAKDTSDAQFDAFPTLLRVAEQSIMAAVEGGREDPTPWSLLLWLAVGQQRERAWFDAAWAELVDRDPAHRTGHIAALQYLSEKWYGSHEDMYAFAHGCPAAGRVGWATVLPLQAHAEYVLREASKGRGPGMKAMALWDWADPQADLDAALGWAREGRPTHAYALHDLTVLQYSLVGSRRWADAAEAFELSGHRGYEYPWYDGGGEKAFAEAHRKAMRARRP